MIVTPDMGEFVGEDQLELLRCEAAQAAGRDQNHGPEPADHHRHLDQRGFEQEHRPADPETSLEFAQALEPVVVQGPELSGSD